jgi:hypothetical protein
MTTLKEDVKKILDKVDWISIHSEYVFGNYNDTINIFDDGTYEVLSSNTTYQSYERVIGIIQIQGFGNIDYFDYLDGWGEWNEEKEIFITNDGRELTREAAIQECIEDGDWSSYIEEWKREILEDVC